MYMEMCTNPEKRRVKTKVIFQPYKEIAPWLNPTRWMSFRVENCDEVKFHSGSDHILGKASASTKRLLHCTLQYAWGAYNSFVRLLVWLILIFCLPKKVFLGALFFLSFFVPHLILSIIFSMYSFWYLVWCIPSFVDFSPHFSWSSLTFAEYETHILQSFVWMKNNLKAEKNEGRFATYHIFSIPRLRSSSWRTLNAWARTQTLHIMKW